MKTTQTFALAALAAALVAIGADSAAQAPAPTELKQPATKPDAAVAAPKPAAHTFASPDEAADALAAAVRAKDAKALVSVVGPGSGSWLFSGDKVADTNDWMKFLASYDEKHVLEKKDEGKAYLEVGSDAWPFPAPIVKKGTRWTFDPAAGREEVLNRRVGRNELDAIQTLLAIVDAQREYAASDADGNGYADYARKFKSSPGKKDGLYWPAENGAPQSPLGPLVATASSQGYEHMKAGAAPSPYHGYFFRILTSQGKDAPGGAYDYMVGDKLLGGFAIVAWPASYGNSGVMTFVVNHEGAVYEKDLGPKTASIASAMTQYNPDPTWRKEQ
ncbi:MAG TPA: DUF2950 domain-containing protein [Usitatibacter sp.]|nr:DUF2950 domain-containing protein [Usitatibacter sp.]